MCEKRRKIPAHENLVLYSRYLGLQINALIKSFLNYVLGMSAFINGVTRVVVTFQTVTMTETRNFYIGLFLATFSSILIGSSFIVKKKALLNLSVRAGKPFVILLLTCLHA